MSAFAVVATEVTGAPKVYLASPVNMSSGPIVSPSAQSSEAPLPSPTALSESEASVSTSGASGFPVAVATDSEHLDHSVLVERPPSRFSRPSSRVGSRPSSALHAPGSRPSSASQKLHSVHSGATTQRGTLALAGLPRQLSRPVSARGKPSTSAVDAKSATVASLSSTNSQLTVAPAPSTVPPAVSLASVSKALDGAPLPAPRPSTSTQLSSNVNNSTSSPSAPVASPIPLPQSSATALSITSPALSVPSSLPSASAPITVSTSLPLAVPAVMLTVPSSIPHPSSSASRASATTIAAAVAPSSSSPGSIVRSIANTTASASLVSARTATEQPAKPAQTVVISPAEKQETPSAISVSHTPLASLSPSVTGPTPSPALASLVHKQVALSSTSVSASSSLAPSPRLNARPLLPLSEQQRLLMQASSPVIPDRSFASSFVLSPSPSFDSSLQHGFDLRSRTGSIASFSPNDSNSRSRRTSAVSLSQNEHGSMMYKQEDEEGYLAHEASEKGRAFLSRPGSSESSRSQDVDGETTDSAGHSEHPELDHSDQHDQSLDQEQDQEPEYESDFSESQGYPMEHEDEDGSGSVYETADGRMVFVQHAYEDDDGGVTPPEYHPAYRRQMHAERVRRPVLPLSQQEEYYLSSPTFRQYQLHTLALSRPLDHHVHPHQPLSDAEDTEVEEEEEDTCEHHFERMAMDEDDTAPPPVSKEPPEHEWKRASSSLSPQTSKLIARTITGVTDMKLGEFEETKEKPKDVGIYKKFLQWMIAGGAKFPHLVLQQYAKDYRGVHIASSHALHKGRILLKIPRHLLITVELARASPIGKLIAPLQNLGSQALLAVYLIQERNAGAASFWKPWMDVLPKAFDTLPMFFPPDELHELKGSDELLQKVANQRRSMEDEYTAIMSAKGMQKFANFTFDDFVWGCLAVGTRVFSLSIDGQKTSVLAPLADMMNHKNPSGTNWTFDTTRDAFTLTTTGTLNDGDPVYESYGAKDNKRFFASYGFVLEDNPANEVTVNIPSDLVLDNLGVRQFTVRGCYDAAAEEMLSFLRLANAHDYQLEDPEAAETLHTGPMSIDNELSALYALRVACKEHLRQYTCSLEEDIRGLAVLNASHDTSLKATRMKMIRLFRIGEKKIYKFFIDWASMAISLLCIPWEEAKLKIRKLSDTSDPEQYCQNWAFLPYISNVVVPLLQERHHAILRKRQQQTYRVVAPSQYAGASGGTVSYAIRDEDEKYWRQSTRVPPASYQDSESEKAYQPRSLLGYLGTEHGTAAATRQLATGARRRELSRSPPSHSPSSSTVFSSPHSRGLSAAPHPLALPSLSPSQRQPSDVSLPSVRSDDSSYDAPLTPPRSKSPITHSQSMYHTPPRLYPRRPREDDLKAARKFPSHFTSSPQHITNSPPHHHMPPIALPLTPRRHRLRAPMPVTALSVDSALPLLAQAQARLHAQGQAPASAGKPSSRKFAVEPHVHGGSNAASDATARARSAHTRIISSAQRQRTALPPLLPPIGS